MRLLSSLPLRWRSSSSNQDSEYDKFLDDLRPLTIYPTGKLSSNRLLRFEPNHPNRVTELSLRSPFNNQLKTVEEPVPGTCEWITRTSEYEAWRAGRTAPRALLIYANPGLGKSVLAKFINDRIQLEYGTHTTLTFFCLRKSPGRSSAVSVLASFLYYLFSSFKAEIQAHGGFKTSLPVNWAKQDAAATFELLWEMFLEWNNQPLFAVYTFIIDGLDQCDESSQNMFRKHICKSIGKLRAHVLITTRPGSNIAIADAIPTIVLNPSLLLPDLGIYVKHGMARRHITPAINGENERFITEKVLQGTQGLYLLCHCRLDAIGLWIANNGTSRLMQNLGCILMQPSSAVTQYFLSLLDTLTANENHEEQRYGIAILNLMIAAPHQMSNEELNVAYRLFRSFATTLGAYKDLTTPVDIIRDAEKFCGPVVGCRRMKKYMQHQEPQLYLLHPLIRHLFDSLTSTHLTAQQRAYLGQIHSARAHQMMAKSCLTYLMFSDLPEPSSTVLKELPFYRYALTNWSMHVRHSKERVRYLIPLLIHFFITQPGGYQMWNRWWLAPIAGTAAGLTPRPMIIVLAEQSLLNVIEQITRVGLSWTLPGSPLAQPTSIDLNQTYGGGTALYAALAEKSLVVAEKLLNLGADPRIADNYGVTPLHIAVSCGSERLIRLCHEKGADLDAESTYAEDCHGNILAGESPLFWSLGPEGRRQTKTFDLLYSLGARKLTRRDRNIPLLSIVASEGDLEFTKYLVEQKIQSLDAKSDLGVTPLIEACRMKSNLKIVKYLIEECGADVSVVDKNGRSPLILALQAPNEESARYLLTREEVLKKNVLDLVDHNGYTAMHWATLDHYTDLVSIMIEHGASVDIRCNKNTTPLLWATRKKFTDLVRILLKAGADPNVADSSGHPPLYIACEEGFHEIAEALMLANAKGVKEEPNINCFHVVGMKNSVSMARLLLASSSNIPEMLNAQGADVRWTPLMASVNYKLYDVAKLLLKQDIDVITPDRDGRLPLHMICANTTDIELFDLAIAKTPEHLLDARTARSSTPLTCAAGSGFAHAVKVLLSKGCKVSSIDVALQTPLILAARAKSSETVKIILEHEQCYPDMRDKHGWKALDYAGCNITDPVALKDLMLRTTWQYQIGAATNPMATAVYNHNSTALRVFLENGMSTNFTCDYGNTPMYDAVELEDGYMTELLLKHGAEHETISGFNILPWLCAFDTPSAVTIELTRPTSIEHLGRKANTNFANALLQASKTSLKDVVWMVENDIDPTTLSLYGCGVLHHATYTRSPELLRYLLKIPKVKAMVNLPSRSYLTTPLHFAASVRSPDCIRILLKAGANRDALDFFGRTALDLVVAYEDEGPRIIDAECASLLSPGGPPPYTTASNADPYAAQNRVRKGAAQIRAILKYLADLKPDDYFFGRRERYAVMMLGSQFLSMKDMPNALTAYEFDYGSPKQDFSGFIDCQCCAKQKARCVGYICKVCTCVSICAECRNDPAVLAKYGCGDHELVQYPRETWLTRSGDHVNDDKQTKDEWLNSLREKYKSTSTNDDDISVQWDYSVTRANIFDLFNSGRWAEFHRHLARYPGDVARIDEEGNDMVLSCISSATDEDECVSRLEKLKYEGARLLVWNATTTSLDMACERRWRKLTEFLMSEWDRRFDKRAETSPVQAMKVMLEEDWTVALKYVIERHFKWVNREPYTALKTMANRHQTIEAMIQYMKTVKPAKIDEQDSQEITDTNTETETETATEKKPNEPKKPDEERKPLDAAEVLGAPGETWTS